MLVYDAACSDPWRVLAQSFSLIKCVMQYYGVAAVACTPNILIAAIVSGFFYGEAASMSDAVAHASAICSLDLSCSCTEQTSCSTAAAYLQVAWYDHHMCWNPLQTLLGAAIWLCP